MRRVLTGLCVLVFSFASQCLAQEAGAPGDLARQLEGARSRLETANRRISALEGTVSALEANLTSSSAASSDLRAEVTALEAKARASKPTGSAFRFSLYGQIKVDMNYDDTRTNATDDAAYVQQEKPGFGSDKCFALTVRQTALGVNILAPDVAGGKQRGRVEIDFYAPASVENKPEPRMKYAYWELLFADSSLLVGQAPDLVSPGAPNTLNRDHLDNSGNIGYRRPMIRYQRLFKLRGGSTCQNDLAIARGTGGPVSSSSSLDDAASDAAWPLLEARSGILIPTSLKRPVVVGISGHVGQEEYDPTSGTPPVPTSGKGDMYMTYSAGIDWSVPLTASLDLAGEVFGGRNLDDFVGGVAQGVNTKLGKPIDASGGWMQVAYKPLKTWTFGLGAGIDDPDNSDLSAGDRTRNTTLFTHAIYAVTDKLSTGLELSYMKTAYKAAPDGDNFRVQTSLIYKF